MMKTMTPPLYKSTMKTMKRKMKTWKSTPKKMQALWMLKLSLRSQLRKGVEKSSLCKLVSLKITNGSIITSQILSVSALGSKTLILISN
jgi:hypothetical protein